MPAVIAIATAPHPTTRAVARRWLPPPSRAPRDPRAASASTVTATHTGARRAAGISAKLITGRTAPAENESADAPAACRGRARRSCSSPSSSRAFAPRASRSVSAAATWRASPKTSDPGRVRLDLGLGSTRSGFRAVVAALRGDRDADRSRARCGWVSHDRDLTVFRVAGAPACLAGG